MCGAVYSPSLILWREVPSTPFTDAHIYAEIDMGPDLNRAIIKAFRHNGKWEYQVNPGYFRFHAIQAFQELWIAPYLEWKHNHESQRIWKELEI